MSVLDTGVCNGIIHVHGPCAVTWTRCQCGAKTAYRDPDGWTIAVRDATAEELAERATAPVSSWRDGGCGCTACQAFAERRAAPDSGPLVALDTELERFDAARAGREREVPVQVVRLQAVRIDADHVVARRLRCDDGWDSIRLSRANLLRMLEILDGR